LSFFKTRRSCSTFDFDEAVVIGNEGGGCDSDPGKKKPAAFGEVDILPAQPLKNNAVSEIHNPTHRKIIIITRSPIPRLFPDADAGLDALIYTVVK
jgi:hypothetical protein